MTHVGWDGTGYRTGLASSDDLLNWKKGGLALGRSPKGSATEHNAALACILRENELFGPGTLKRANGRFVGTYHAYPEPGCEAGPAVIGPCYSDDLRAWVVPKHTWIRCEDEHNFRLLANGLEEMEVAQPVGAEYANAGAIEAEAAAVQQRVDRLDQAVLARAFRGELVSQNPDDKPASALLAGVRVVRNWQTVTFAINGRLCYNVSCSLPHRRPTTSRDPACCGTEQRRL